MTSDTRPQPAFARIADALGETERQPRGQLRAIVAALGERGNAAPGRQPSPHTGRVHYRGCEHHSA
jgi:hypothetical protein